MSGKNTEFKKEIVYYAKLLDEKGLVNTLEGNLSILDRETGKMYITPSGTRKRFLNEDKIAVVKDKEQIEGTVKKSSEILLHEAALKARPDCNAAAHIHAPYLTAYAYCGKDIKLKCSTTFSLVFEEIPCLPYGLPGTIHIADGIEDAIKDHDLILLGNHGCIAVGKVMISEMSEEEIYKLFEDKEELPAYTPHTILTVSELIHETEKVKKQGYGVNDEEYWIGMYCMAVPVRNYTGKIVAVGLCGSDIRNLTTDSKSGKYPHIYGHEITGIIDEISPSCTEYKVGDRLYIYPADHCMQCEPCRTGHSEMCENLGNNLDRPGGFAQYYTVLPRQIARDVIYRIPDGISYDRASLGEPLSSVYACQENINVGFGDIIVIIGAGPIGCFHAKLAKLRGAKKVIMIEINDNRLETAKQFGVDHTINSLNEDPIDAVRKLTNGKGADKVISANPSTQAQSQAIFMAKRTGIVVFFGGVAKGALTELDTNYIHYNGLWIYGHYGSNSMQVQKSFELAISDEFEAEKFITHILPLSEINKGIALTKSGEAIKVVLHPNDQ